MKLSDEVILREVKRYEASLKAEQRLQESAPAPPTADELKAQEAERDAFASAFSSGDRNSQGFKVMKEGRSAFDPRYNAGDKGNGLTVGVGTVDQ